MIRFNEGIEADTELAPGKRGSRAKVSISPHRKGRTKQKNTGWQKVEAI